MIGNSKRLLLYTLAVFILHSVAPAQGAGLDRISVLNDSSKVNGQKGNNREALLYAGQAESLAEKLLKSNPDTATENKLKLELCKSMNISGLIYYSQGEYSRSLECHFKSLKLAEELRNNGKAASSFNNIGLVYRSQDDFLKAIHFYNKCRVIREAMRDSEGLEIVYGNIGSIYSYTGEFRKALEFHFKSLQIAMKTGNKEEIATTYNNIGLIYSAEGKIDTSLLYFFKALKIMEEINDKEGIALLYTNIGGQYFLLNQYSEAMKYLNQGLEISTKMKYLNGLLECYRTLTNLYEKTHRPEKALQFYKLFTAAKDSLDNTESTRKSVRAEMNYEFEKKQTIEKIQEEKKDALHAEEVRRQKITVYSVSGILFLSAVFSLFLYRSYRQKELVNAKLEEKNKEVLDSIHYAKRIQEALLLEEEHVSAHLPPHFILFKPKDIVSGDFYWALEKQTPANTPGGGGRFLYIAAVDCTGHGVPGAFMSMLGIAFLNEITSGESLLPPSEILNLLRKKIIEELRQTGEAGQNMDGMDISLALINLETKEVSWAGANNSVYQLRNSKLQETKGDKQPIGYHPVLKPFTNHTFRLNSGVTLYMFTDGYADQFGGPKGKKFKYKRLEELLQANAHLPMEEQKSLLSKVFEEWKGNYEQIDDVTVIGLRL